MKFTVAPTITDRLVGLFSPEAMLRRVSARNTMAILGGVPAPTGGPSHTGASSKRTLRGWGVSGGDADADLLDDLESLRPRSRDLYRNNPVARGAVRTLRTNVVGSGLRLNAAIDRDFLGLTDEQAEAWERTVEREFDLWARSQYSMADLTGNFYSSQGTAFLAALCSGDVFALLPWKPRHGFPYDLRVQLIEADRVCNPNLKPDTATLAGGVETDDAGAPLKYWVCTPHPGAVTVAARKWKGVPAFGARTGRRNVLHLFDQERPGQRRGAPFLAPVIDSLRTLGKYTEAELMAAVVSGLYTVFVTSEAGDPAEGLGAVDGFGQDVGVGPVAAENEMALGPGAVVGLAPGERVETTNPGRPNTAFDPFVQAIIRQIGSALEIPFELLIKHFSASYSASRAALLEAWKFFRHRRDWLVAWYCAPVYEAWLTEAVIKGRISAPGFLGDHAVRAAYLGAEWVGPSMGQIDPLKEVSAAKMRVEECFSTRTREAAELTGADYERTVRRRGREEAMRREYDLGPVAQAQPGQAVATQPQGEDDAADE